MCSADNELLYSLEQLVEKLGCKVRYDSFQNEYDIPTLGGSCRIGKQQALLIDKKLSAKERAWLIRDFLRDQELGHIFIPPKLRQYLGNAEED